MKFYCAAIGHETSKVSPIPTNLDSYREAYLYLPNTGEGAKWLDQILEEVSWSRILKARGHEAVFGPLASAQPSRPTSRDAYAVLKGSLIGALTKALPIDGVLLFLHGAQMAYGVDDCEGDMLSAVRAIAGPNMPVGVVFDLHGNVSSAMIENADILLGCLEYPHTDFYSRAEEVCLHIERMVKGQIRPVTAHRRVPMLGTYYTTASPMREFVDWAKSFEGKGSILGVSIVHGFPWSDTADCGNAVIVHADDDPDAAARLADEISARYFELRDAIRSPLISLDQALAQALAHKTFPVVIADVTDNPGAGAASDSTFWLQALLDSGVTNAAVGMIWDPVAVQIAHRAGTGARLPMRIGGKTGPGSGPPLDIDATVLVCRNDATQNAQGMQSPLGSCALIETKGIRIVLNSIRQQMFDTACFEQFGVDPRTCRIVVVKSQQHFHTAFSPFASKIIYSNPPGTVNMDYRNMRFANISRPVYPIDNPPFTAFGKVWRT